MRTQSVNTGSTKIHGSVYKSRAEIKDILVVLDFDGFLVNSYALLQLAFGQFGLDIGDEDRFKHRRKFLKYIGGGKEFLGNLVSYSLPKKKKVRQVLTDVYINTGRIHAEFVALINRMIEEPSIHVGIISRNFTHSPGTTIRTVLKRSEVDEAALDFVVPIPVGAKKQDVLEGMQSSRYKKSLFGADEIGDYRAAYDTGYDSIVMASYGFDNRERLIKTGEIPPHVIFDTPVEVVEELRVMLNQTKLQLV